jgi:tetratricopeptide (TPR) repeat protein
MSRAAALLALCLTLSAAALPAQAANYGCRVRVVGAFTSEKAIRQLSAYINSSEAHRVGEALGTAYYCRGQLHDLDGVRDLAIADYSSSIASNPHESGVYYARGDAYADAGQGDKAALDYAEGDRLGGNVPAKRATLCWQRAVRGRPLDRALADCDAALKSEPDNAQWLDIRGFVNFRMSRYPEAIADLDAVVKQKPRDAAALFVRGLAKLRAGDAAGGNADAEAAKNIDYHIAETYAVFGIKP